MIVFDLSCDSGHRFEGWFGSSADFAGQQEKGLIACPQCGSIAIGKAPMAPAVPRKGNRGPEAAPATPASAPVSIPAPAPSSAPATMAPPVPMPPQVAEALMQLARVQAESLKSSTWVGDDFAEVSRAMFYGEQDKAAIHGEVSPQEARDLLEEGVPVAPLLFPVAPPDELN